MSGHLAVTPYRPLSEVVYSKLREAIYEGTLGPGQRLVQADLARKLGVSRIPVREALHRLSEEGLVVCRPHKGATVRRPIASELQESSAATRILVRAAMEHVVERITDSQIAKLERLHSAMLERAAQGRVGELAVLNRRFHRFIFKCDGLGKLYDCMDALMTLAARGRQVMAEHAEILAAIQARDKVKLLAAADRHTTNNAQTLLGLITAGTAADDCAAL